MNKQEFLNGQIVLFNGDCLDVMRNLKDKEIDLVLTDPPYGIGVDGGIGGGVLAKKSDFEKKGWDKKSPENKAFEELLRISENQIIFGANHFISKIPYDSSSWIVWDKDNGDNNFADCELAWTSHKTAVRKFRWKWQGMLQQNMKDKDVKIHPTQKPVALMNWCLNNYSQENDLIFDGFLGSGTTAIACIRTKRRLIGCELDNEYFDKMCKRIEEELKQGNLF
jgi:site-specific DNA-methyltransferase (adenine-specific)